MFVVRNVTMENYTKPKKGFTIFQLILIYLHNYVLEGDNVTTSHLCLPV